MRRDGRFGDYGGAHVPEILFAALEHHRAQLEEWSESNPWTFEDKLLLDWDFSSRVVRATVSVGVEVNGKRDPWFLQVDINCFECLATELFNGHNIDHNNTV